MEYGSTSMSKLWIFMYIWMYSLVGATHNSDSFGTKLNDKNHESHMTGWFPQV